MESSGHSLGRRQSRISVLPQWQEKQVLENVTILITDSWNFACRRLWKFVSYVGQSGTLIPTEEQWFVVLPNKGLGKIFLTKKKKTHENWEL